MTVKKKKSKKQSDANSKEPLEDYAFFLDRNLGKHIIAEALRATGCVVHLHDDHLPPDVPDELWISLVGSRNWLAITKDKNIKYRYGELRAIKEHCARVFVVRAKNATGKELAQVVICATTKLQKFARKNAAPFVAGISRGGKIQKYDI